MTSVNSTTSAPLQLTVHPESSFWSDDAPGFSDLLDAINPLQHIPIVSNIYQSLTGDTQSTGSKLLGGTLFGGPIGFLTSLFGAIVEGETGKDVGGHVVAMFDGSESSQQVASVQPRQPSGMYALAEKSYKNASMLG